METVSRRSKLLCSSISISSLGNPSQVFAVKMPNVSLKLE